MSTSRNYFFVMCAMLLLTACSNRPTQELATASNAVDELIGEGAELFAPEELREINDKLVYAIGLIRSEDHDLVKNYRLASHILQQVINEADDLQVIVIRRKEALHETAIAALKTAHEAINEVSMTLTEILSDPMLSVNAKRLRYDIDQLIFALDAVPRQIAIGEFVVASERARSIAEQATALTQTLHMSRSVGN